VRQAQLAAHRSAPAFDRGDGGSGDGTAGGAPAPGGVVMALWLLPQPLVLASQSAARRTTLLAAGIPIEVVPAALDEREVSEQASNVHAVASLLAREKALAVAAGLPGRFVLGADQTLLLGAPQVTKPADPAAAGGAPPR